ncbi:hypothetical protein G7Y89_g13673 [Cudoniella acicularis]|uniref:Dnase1 protein n=1 Tax=Cudoniella acicularis TaxID=354080 RepID=A0A8H4R6F9_9HELO|nr:hypothetical protein G7Y89_g13673 [Cudoniella acicularis]
MQLINNLLLAATALATLAAAGSVNFVNQDGTTRTIKFTANSGLEAIPDLIIKGYGTATQDFPEAWIGNWYSVSEGAADVPGMLGEVRFNGYAGANYFDVSAIVNPNDKDGVKEIFPKNSNTPVSGCQTFPCSNAYNQPDDIATLSTTDDELVCLLGNLSNERKRGLVSRVSRRFATS